MSFTFVQKTPNITILTADYSPLTYNKPHFSLQFIVTEMHLNNIQAQLDWNINFKRQGKIDSNKTSDADLI